MIDNVRKGGFAGTEYVLIIVSTTSIVQMDSYAPPMAAWKIFVPKTIIMASAVKCKWSALKGNAKTCAKTTLNADYRSTALRECVKGQRVSIPQIVKSCL